MNRNQKKQFVELMHQEFSNSQSVVVVHYKGLTVAEISDLRRKANKAGAKFKVTKNKLAKLALAETGFGGLKDKFIGQTAIAYSSDAIAAAKLVVDYAKQNDKLVVIGGMVNNQLLDAKDVDKLAKLPSLDELRSIIIGLINAPATKIAGVLQAPAGQLARVVQAYANK